MKNLFISVYYWLQSKQITNNEAIVIWCCGFLIGESETRTVFLTWTTLLLIVLFGIAGREKSLK